MAGDNVVTRTDFTQLADRDSGLTRTALQHKCIICRASKGRVCTDTITGQPLHQAHDRWVNLARLLNEEDE